MLAEADAHWAEAGRTQARPCANNKSEERETLDVAPRFVSKKQVVRDRSAPRPLSAPCGPSRRGPGGAGPAGPWGCATRLVEESRRDSPLGTTVVAEDSVTGESHESRGTTVSHTTEHTGAGADQSCVAVPTVRTLSGVPLRNRGPNASPQAVLTGPPCGYREDSGRVPEVSPRDSQRFIPLRCAAASGRAGHSCRPGQWAGEPPARPGTTGRLPSVAAPRPADPAEAAES